MRGCLHLSQCVVVLSYHDKEEDKEVTAERNVVKTYRKKGTFRAQHAEKTGRAAQNTPLPPRCDNENPVCRLPGTIPVSIDGITHHYCIEHAPI